MSGILNITVGNDNGRPTVVVALGGMHPKGSELETIALHVMDAIERAATLLEERGTPVEFIVMDDRDDESQPNAGENKPKRGRKPLPVDKSA